MDLKLTTFFFFSFKLWKHYAKLTDDQIRIMGHITDMIESDHDSQSKKCH